MCYPKSNILLSLDGDPLIADFGLSNKADEQINIESRQEDHSEEGLRWMPPELVKHNAGARALSQDIWSLGMVYLVRTLSILATIDLTLVCSSESARSTCEPLSWAGEAMVGH